MIILKVFLSCHKDHKADTAETLISIWPVDLGTFQNYK